jgi:acyl-CoA thioesterase-1
MNGIPSALRRAVIKSSSMTRALRNRELLFLSLLLVLSSRILVAAVRVINEGVPGESSTEVGLRLDAALKQYKPQFVVIFVGMNDAVNDRKFLSPEQTGGHVDAMIKQSQAIGAAVVIVSVHQPDMVRLLQRHKPEAYDSVSPTQRIDRVNNVLQIIAQRNHATFADFHEALNKAGGADIGMSTDGVHLTAKGYALLASTVRNALPSHIDPESTVLCMGDSLTYGIGVRPVGRAPEDAMTYPAQLQSLLRAETTVQTNR